MKKSIMFVVAFTFTACAGAGIGFSKDLQRESARAIGDVQPDTIDVNNISRVPTLIKWVAETTQGYYNCTADGMLQKTICVKRQ